LVGFQSETDVTHFTHYVQSEAHAEQLSHDRLRAFNRTLRVGAYPIGIDVDEVVNLAQAKEGRDTFARMREEYSRRRLLLGGRQARLFERATAADPRLSRTAGAVPGEPKQRDVDPDCVP
jgi:trehalose-6-phosphate synthase